MSDIMKTKIRSLAKTLFVPFLLLTLIVTVSNVTYAHDDVKMILQDTPGNWFMSEGQTILPAANGTPLAIIDPGDEVRFVIDEEYTNTLHTVTMLVKPGGTALGLFTPDTDQAKPDDDDVDVEFDAPGVYLWICKVHPYMTGVVAVRNSDPSGPLDIPDVTPDELPFIGHLTDALGLPAGTTLPATTVLGVTTTVAPIDDAGPFGLMGKLSPTPLFPAGHPLVGANGAFGPKWDIFTASEFFPQPGEDNVIPGVGEVWVDTQFEHVSGQSDEEGALKPGTITVVDAATFTVEREINGLGADGMWNNPHNMWANFALDTIYNGNWFGKWINKIGRASGAIEDSIEVGEAPTHIITIPPSLETPDVGQLVIPLSAENDIVKLTDIGCCLSPAGSFPSGDLAGIDGTHPHGHWLSCGTGGRITVPNVFNGLGPQGKISILDTSTGNVEGEFGAGNGVVMPLAAGECHVDEDSNPLTPDVNKAYVSDIVTGQVHVIDVGSEGGDAPNFITSIPVTLKPNAGGAPNHIGGSLFDTLQVPIQTPVSPDGRFVATAVLSLTTVPRDLPTGGSSADHVAIIDAKTDTVVKWLATPAGTHGVNWGAKDGGGYYAYVTNQHANVMTIIDPDPNGDGVATDAMIVANILLANGEAGLDTDGNPIVRVHVTDGTGGQGVKPLPIVHDGWIQPTVALAEPPAGPPAVSDEVKDWITALTLEQKEAH